MAVLEDKEATCLHLLLLADTEVQEFKFLYLDHQRLHNQQEHRDLVVELDGLLVAVVVVVMLLELVDQVAAQVVLMLAVPRALHKDLQSLRPLEPQILAVAVAALVALSTLILVLVVLVVPVS